MRAKKAKKIRNDWYEDKSTRPENRKHFQPSGRGIPIISDTDRRTYQYLKKLYRQKKKSMKELRKLMLEIKSHLGQTPARERAGHSSLASAPSPLQKEKNFNC